MRMRCSGCTSRDQWCQLEKIYIRSHGWGNLITLICSFGQPKYETRPSRRNVRPKHRSELFSLKQPTCGLSVCILWQNNAEALRPPQCHHQCTSRWETAVGLDDHTGDQNCSPYFWMHRRYCQINGTPGDGRKDEKEEEERRKKKTRMDEDADSMARKRWNRKEEVEQESIMGKRSRKWHLYR